MVLQPLTHKPSLALLLPCPCYIYLDDYLQFETPKEGKKVKPHKLKLFATLIIYNMKIKHLFTFHALFAGKKHI